MFENIGLYRSVNRVYALLDFEHCCIQVNTLGLLTNRFLIPTSDSPIIKAFPWLDPLVSSRLEDKLIKYFLCYDI